MEHDFAAVKNDAEQAITELLSLANLKPGSVVVLGASSSEIIGERIGKGSSLEAAQAVIGAILPYVTGKGLFLAVQGCEHINRALVIEREAAERYGFEVVSVVPARNAGGACATTAYKAMKDPVMIEHVTAQAGIDIGDTFIGMHIKHVLVPARISVKRIGAAHVTCAVSRPKLIGGERAVYSLD